MSSSSSLSTTISVPNATTNSATSSSSSTMTPPLAAMSNANVWEQQQQPSSPALPAKQQQRQTTTTAVTVVDNGHHYYSPHSQQPQPSTAAAISSASSSSSQSHDHQQQQQQSSSSSSSSCCPSSSTHTAIVQAAAAATHSSSSTNSNSTQNPTTTKPVVVVRERPAVPPKPQLDVVRFSMAQARDELDLDTILTELLELENQLSGEAGDQLVFGLPSLPINGEKQQQPAKRLPDVRQQQKMPEQQPQLAKCITNPLQRATTMMMAAPVEQMAKKVQFQQFVNSSAASPPPSASPTLSSGGGSVYSAANTNQPDCAILTATSSNTAALSRLPARQQQQFAGGNEPCASPDADSAFGDSSSTESAHPPISGGNNIMTRTVNGCGGGAGGGSSSASSNSSAGDGARSSEFSSAESFRCSLLNTPSPTHQSTTSVALQQQNGIALAGRQQTTTTMFQQQLQQQQRPVSSADSYTSALSRDEQKKAKIREALEKMKEAKMKKVFVKIFLEDGSQRGLLLDERWSVAETMRQLADKINCPLSQEHAIVEEYPHLHIKRVYEDHEFVVENLEEWTSDSPNKLHFVRVPTKWALFRHPQHFLLTDRNRNEFPAAENKPEWNGATKQRLIDTYLNEDGANRVPELEGWLLLKADGKKSWRRHFFVLRASGLYYVPKAGKPRGPTRDLQCLMSVFNNQVYTCTDWRKKYKAPNNWGFAIKHPRIQVKTSKYIKYICAEDEVSFMQWMTALRIIKNGFPTLHKAFCASAFCQIGKVDTPPAADVPPFQRLSSVLDPHQQQLDGVASPFQHSSPSSNSIISSSVQSTVQSSPRHQQQHPAYLKSLYQQQFGNGFVSPVVMRASFASSSSRASQMGSPCHVATSNGIAFDQDQCNTIKRQPEPMIMMFASSSASSAMSNQQMQELNREQSATPSGTYTMRAGSGCGTPTTSNSLIMMETATQNAVESDSDEEQFPPPPPLVEAGLLHKTVVEHKTRPSAISSPQNLATTTTTMMGTLSLQHSTSPWRSANGNCAATPPPPPPPKRSEGTRLRTGGGGMMMTPAANAPTACNNSGGAIGAGGGSGATASRPETINMQMNLMAELQLATSRQKLRLEQNLG